MHTINKAKVIIFLDEHSKSKEQQHAIRRQRLADPAGVADNARQTLGSGALGSADEPASQIR